MNKIFLLISLLTFGGSQLFGQDQMELLATWSDSSLPAGTQYNNTYNEVWGFVMNSHEYAVIGSTMGTHILDVTDPDNVFEREYIEGASAGGHIVHRDFHDYKGYLYAVADESGGGTNSTLQIIDISQLPESISVVYDDDDLIERTHNIFIDTTSAKMYACAAKGGDSGYKALKIYTLENPVDPVKIGQYGVIGGESFGHVHDAFVDDDKAFLNCGGDGLFVVDFSGDDPVLLDRFSAFDYPESGYNHSGWPTEDGEYYYFADETWGTALKTVKINDFVGLEIENVLFDAGNDDPNSIAHNQVVHCGKLYVSYYYDGLQVYDLSNPAEPTREAFYPTSNIEPRNNYEGAWGVYPFLPSGNIIVSDMQEGFFLLKGITDVCSTPAKNDDYQGSYDVKIFPNPSQGELVIESVEKIEKVEVYDLQGQLMPSSFDSNSQLLKSLDYLPSGMYILKIQILGAAVTQKHMIIQE